MICRDATTGKKRLFHHWLVEFIGFTMEVQYCTRCLLRKKRIW
jgi:hypothetical protein